ncbi:Gfo/Idh/MocA family protein [Roseateles oligotrophus]|uniref:Gfo/Idh/MocA family oxidoreductase n=1 Tax=Roseateles oligotrophus TaxID=1769250 RepID=A0ABT2YHX9_9BURK|nr:Gfo/Idh/MocA family oxidoreductase [Roseateles oligotrophus]MCV2369638.1 Gfo/Idh/MocA family oxidoreductase [Roseateles oligotrophus]
MSVDQSYQRPLLLGMVGGGEGAFIGAVHRIAARLDGEFELVAGALSSQPERAAASGAALGLAPERCYADWREMARVEAARPDGIELVAIVTPNHLHAPVARAFLEAGIDVLCDKPLAISVQEGRELAALAQARKRLLAVSYNYSAYPMLRHARELVRAGELGELRLIQVEYAQDWLALPVEKEGQKQASWRCDPALAGPAGALGDIGTHAYQLACFVSGLRAVAVCAELSSFVPGRRLDDNAQLMLRFAGGARGALWASQVASGCENALRLRIYGSKAGLEFEQEQPNRLRLTCLGGSSEWLSRGRVDSAAAIAATRLPPGHPEGYLEAFAQIYREAAEHIRARQQGRSPAPQSLALPQVGDGLAGLLFVDAALRSHRAGGIWSRLEASIEEDVGPMPTHEEMAK